MFSFLTRWKSNKQLHDEIMALRTEFSDLSKAIAEFNANASNLKNLEQLRIARDLLSEIRTLRNAIWFAVPGVREKQISLGVGIEEGTHAKT